jgi:hypothetical protein
MSHTDLLILMASKSVVRIFWSSSQSERYNRHFTEEHKHHKSTYRENKRSPRGRFAFRPMSKLTNFIIIISLDITMHHCPNMTNLVAPVVVDQYHSILFQGINVRSTQDVRMVNNAMHPSLTHFLVRCLYMSLFEAPISL